MFVLLKTGLRGVPVLWTLGSRINTEYLPPDTVCGKMDDRLPCLFQVLMVVCDLLFECAGQVPLQGLIHRGATQSCGYSVLVIRSVGPMGLLLCQLVKC